MDVIDGHCHAGLGDGFSGPWDTEASLTLYRRRAARAGITHTLLLPAFHSDYAQANRALARLVAADPRHLAGFAMVHAERDRGRVHTMLRQAIEHDGLAGIKLHRHDAPITREVCDAARALRVPVLYDVVGEVSVVELLAPQYRDVDFIIPHLGSFADDWRAQQALIDPLVRHPNLYADTSGVRRFDLLVQAVRRAGAHKLVFGSDGPWLHPALELAKIRLLGLAPADEARVLGGTLRRLAPRAWPDAAVSRRADAAAPAAIAAHGR